jgi:hypothetical protein
MRTLVLYKRDNEQFGCIVDHHESIVFEEDEAERVELYDHLGADAHSMFYVELPDDTFRPAVFSNEGEECAVMFHEIAQRENDND